MFRSVVDNNLFTLTLIVWKSADVSVCWAEASLMQRSIDRRENQPAWSCNILGLSLWNQRSPHVCLTTNSEHLPLADSGLKCFLLFQNYSSTLFCLVQISPGHSSLSVDPHSFPVTMVQYFLFVDAFSSGVCGFSALAAFSQYWKLWIDFKVNHFCWSGSWRVWHAARGPLRLLSQQACSFFFFFALLLHDMTAGLCARVCTRVGFGVPLHPGWPQVAARRRVMTPGISASDRAACPYLLSAFFRPP